MSDWNENTIAEFRANEGRVGGMFEKMTLLLLHTTGQRTGQERVNPLAYMADGDRWVVFASKGGHVFHPHWLHNLEANPAATIEVGTETIPVTATILREGPERDELWKRQVALLPQFGEYEEKTAGHRTIPVIVLQRAE
jgi:deazaflavin-dependent oxidoreductase (nitroreductase family)